MARIDIPLNLERFETNSQESRILAETLAVRESAAELFAEARFIDAMERTVTALRTLREFPDYDNVEFRAALAALLFDLSEIHFSLKNYKQSEKELDILFKVLDNLVKIDNDRFGPFHILAMELSTRLMRSRKKALDLLLKHQMNAEVLYAKVNAGVVNATDKLVDSLRNIAQLLAATGDLKGAMKFFAEAIKYSKKRTGRVTLKELKMSVEMAEIMVRIRHMRPRAQRLLETVLPHAISLKAMEEEQNILALLEVIENDTAPDSTWRSFMLKVTNAAKSRFSSKKSSQA